MIRRWISTGGRWGVVAIVALVELALAWLLGLAATAPLTGALSRHPRGAFALGAEGGRLLGELLVTRAQALQGTGAVVAVVVLAYAAAWVLLGGMFPVVGASAGVRWHRAAAESLRRAPTLLGLAAIAGLGFVLSAVAGYLAWGSAERAAAHRFDARAISLLGLAGWGVAAALGWLISVWHDVARVHAMARGKGALEASGAAASQMLREPLSTVAAGAGFGLVSWAWVAVAALAAGVLEWRASVAAVAVLLVVRHVAVLARVHARMKWFVWLGARPAVGRDG